MFRPHVTTRHIQRKEQLLRRRLLALSGLALASISCVSELDELDEFDEAVETVDSELIVGSRNWYPLTSMESSSTYLSSALYGRAAGRTDTYCSGFLIDDDIFVTAHHCHRSSLEVTFGRYGDVPGDYSRANAEARRRLRQVGVPITIVDGLASSTFRTFTCRWERRDSGYRDIEFYRCNTNLIEWREQFQNSDRVVRYGLKPGHVWGHFEVGGSRAEGTRLNIIANNQRWSDSPWDTLLSRGEVIDRDDDCTEGYSHCFEHSGDTLTGSSGGAILDRNTHRVFGVVQGSHQVIKSENYGTYWGAVVHGYLTAQTHGGWATGVWGEHTAWVGGGGGSNKRFSCPLGMMAAGVIGSTSASGYVGNLGLVCVPHYSASHMRLDRAKVVVGGSHDTEFVTGAHDFNVYTHETRSSTAAATHLQSLTLCPPGFFMYGMSVNEGRYVNAINSINCEDPQSGALARRNVRQGASDNTIGARLDEDWTTIDCPVGQYMARLDINSGWVTDGFRVRCRYED